MSRGTCLAICCAAGLVLAPAALAGPASGPHETVAVASSTMKPNSSTGFSYAATYHGLSGPHSDPPALRHLVIQLPAGTRIDTSVPGQCNVSDADLMLMGEAACPANAKVGTGMATAKLTGLGTMTFNTVLYNARGQQLELVESGGRVMGIAHTYVHGTTLDGPVPTCFTGGQPPSGCPFDEVALLSNHLASVPISTGRGRGRRSYGMTPPSCPSSHRWKGAVTFFYGDGSADRVTVYQRCTLIARKPHR